LVADWTKTRRGKRDKILEKGIDGDRQNRAANSLNTKRTR